MNGQPEKPSLTCDRLEEAHSILFELTHTLEQAKSVIGVLSKRVGDSERQAKESEEMVSSLQNELAVMKSKLDIVSKVYNRLSKWVQMGGVLTGDYDGM